MNPNLHLLQAWLSGAHPLVPHPLHGAAGLKAPVLGEGGHHQRGGHQPHGGEVQAGYATGQLGVGCSASRLKLGAVALSFHCYY